MPSHFAGSVSRRRHYMWSSPLSLGRHQKGTSRSRSASRRVADISDKVFAHEVDNAGAITSLGIGAILAFISTSPQRTTISAARRYDRAAQRSSRLQDTKAACRRMRCRQAGAGHGLRGRRANTRSTCASVAASALLLRAGRSLFGRQP